MDPVPLIGNFRNTRDRPLEEHAALIVPWEAARKRLPTRDRLLDATTASRRPIAPQVLAEWIPGVTDVAASSDLSKRLSRERECARLRRLGCLQRWRTGLERTARRGTTDGHRG